MNAPTPSNTSSLPVETIAADGKVPEKRLSSPTKARELVALLIEANKERSRRNTKIKGMIDGNRPYNPATLKNNGQSYRTNVNFLEGKATISSACTPYYDLFAGGAKYAEVVAYADTPDDIERFSNVISEEFDDLLKKHFPGFSFRINSLIWEFVTFGKGFLVWEDKDNWQFRHAKQCNVLVPDSEEANVEEVEIVVIRHAFKIHRLYNHIKDQKAASAVGWNVQAVKDAIIAATPKVNNQNVSFEDIQQAMKDGDLCEGHKNATIQAAHAYVREFSGKVSHMIVLEEGQSNSFLFEKRGRYEEMQQAIAPFFWEIGDGSWNGTSGLGKDLYAPVEIKNRLRCSMIDNGFLSSSIVIQAKDSTNAQKLSIIQQGPTTILPSGCEVMSGQLLAPLDGLIKLNFDIDNLITSTTSVHRPRLQKTDGNPITAEQAKIDQINQTVLGNSAVDRFYGSLDKAYAEVYRRATSKGLEAFKQSWAKAAVAFRKRCIERGVPEWAIDKATCVRAVRNIGNGSVYMRQQNIQQLSAFVAMMPEEGRSKWLEDMVSAIAGQQKADRYVGAGKQQNMPNDEQAYAFIENAIIKDNAPVVWTPRQNNVIHLQAHLLAASQAAATLEKGGNPVDILAFIDGIGAHCAFHFKSLQSDPSRKQALDALMDQWQQLGRIADQLRSTVKHQMESEQRTQEELANANDKAQALAGGTDPDLIVQAAKVQADSRLKEVKAGHQMKLKQQQTQQKMAIADEMAAQKLATQKKLNEAKTTSQKAK